MFQASDCGHAGARLSVDRIDPRVAIACSVGKFAVKIECLERFRRLPQEWNAGRWISRIDPEEVKDKNDFVEIGK